MPLLLSRVTHLQQCGGDIQSVSVFLLGGNARFVSRIPSDLRRLTGRGVPRGEEVDTSCTKHLYIGS